MKKQYVQVTITRGNDKDVFQGCVVGETTTHYKVTWKDNSVGELFAKASACVNCRLLA